MYVHNSFEAQPIVPTSILDRAGVTAKTTKYVVRRTSYFVSEPIG